MNRAGREPAEDVKRRMVSACQEVGLVVNHANMQLDRASSQRLVHVGASVAEWPHAVPTLSIMAWVPISGGHPQTVDIRCAGADDDPVLGNTLWMRGRGQVPFAQLIGELHDTLAERHQVLAFLRAGLPGPYRFEKTVWAGIDFCGDDAADG